MANEIDDGGPAFACSGLSGLPNDQFLYGNNGMSLREYFAAHCPITLSEFLMGWKLAKEAPTEVALARFAAFRFDYADAMLYERAKKREEAA